MNMKISNILHLTIKLCLTTVFYVHIFGNIRLSLTKRFKYGFRSSEVVSLKNGTLRHNDATNPKHAQYHTAGEK